MTSLESTIQRINEVTATMEAQGLKITPAVVIELTKQAHNEFMKGQRRPAMPDFSEPRFNTEMIVYTIQNSQNIIFISYSNFPLRFTSRHNKNSHH